MITIDQQVIVDRHPVLASPKTSASLRDVPMPRFVLRAVMAHADQLGLAGEDVLCRDIQGNSAAPRLLQPEHLEASHHGSWAVFPE